jgi:hypothetical protein
VKLAGIFWPMAATNEFSKMYQSKGVKVLCFDTFLQVFLLNDLLRSASLLTSKINYLMATPEYWDEILAFFAGWAQKTNEL